MRLKLWGAVLSLHIFMTTAVTAAIAVCDPGEHSILPPPDITVCLDRPTVVEGQALYVTMLGRDRAQRGSVSGPGGTGSLYRCGERLVGWSPVPLGTTPGPHQLTISVETEDGRRAVLPIRIDVVEGRFSEQHLEVSSELMALGADTARAAADRRRLAAAFSTTAAHSLSARPFIAAPAAGRVSTGFGQRRYINGVLRGFHSGIDIAAPTGTPVVAANDGRVVLAADLLLQGLTVIIDHGQSLHSVYYHLSSVFVSEGQFVSRGEEIGQVGSTGFSTGPHLHWGIMVGGVPTNPAQFDQYPPRLLPPVTYGDRP